MWRTSDGRFVVSGCMHMHTRYSDGSGTVSDLVAAASAVGLDFIVITDHRDLRARAERGRHGDLQVVVGYEHNDTDSKNHYLAMGLDTLLEDGTPPAEVPRQVRDAGGLGIIAHPEERRAAFEDLPPYPWTAWASDDFDGIELWNQMSEWTEHLTPWNRLFRVWSPRKALRGPSERIMYLWDVLNCRRRVAGIAGVDAHSYPYRLGPFRIKIFPYKVHFRTLRTHVVFDREPAADPDGFERQLLAGIRDCRVFFSSERWGASRGFDMYVESGTCRAGIGDELIRESDAVLHARWPLPAEYRLIRNGFPVQRGRGERLDVELPEAGTYRLELHRRGRGWIYSNHVRLVDA